MIVDTLNKRKRRICLRRVKTLLSIRVPIAYMGKLKMDIYERPLVGYCAVMETHLIQNLKRIGLHLEVAQVT